MISLYLCESTSLVNNISDNEYLYFSSILLSKCFIDNV